MARRPVSKRDDDRMVVVSVAELDELQQAAEVLVDKAVELDRAQRSLDVHTRLAEIMSERQLNPSAVARRAGLPRDAVRDILTGRSKHPRADTIAKIAAALEIDPSFLIGVAEVATMAAEPAERSLPIRCEVAAGQWLAQDDFRDEPLGFYPALTIKGFEHVQQWLERVRGDSMNKRLPDGALVHVLDAIDLGYEPRHGDLVIVERSRAQGAFTERSIKEVELTPSGQVELWPRSFNPRWAEPLQLTTGVRPDEDVEVAIRGLVYTAYIPFAHKP